MHRMLPITSHTYEVALTKRTDRRYKQLTVRVVAGDEVSAWLIAVFVSSGQYVPTGWRLVSMRLVDWEAPICAQ